MKYRFHAHYAEYLTLDVEAESLEAAREIANNSCGGDWAHVDSGDWVIEEEPEIIKPEHYRRGHQSEWLRDFNAEFMRRAGITWADAGNTGCEALDQYYPQDVIKAVLHYIEKYDLNDITL